MLKFTRSFIFFTTCLGMGLLCLLSCSHDPSSENKQVFIKDAYATAFNKAQIFNKICLDKVSSSSSRATSKDDILGYLLSLSPEEIDSLYNKLGGDNRAQLSDSLCAQVLDSLSDAYPEDLAKLNNIVQDYIASGGHNFQRIDSLLVPLDSSFMISLGAKTLATYDALSSVNSAKFFIPKDKSRATYSCVSQLMLDCGASMIDLAYNLAGTEIDGFQILGCTLDIFDIVKGIRNYHRCERMESWRNTN